MPFYFYLQLFTHNIQNIHSTISLKQFRTSYNEFTTLTHEIPFSTMLNSKQCDMRNGKQKRFSHFSSSNIVVCKRPIDFVKCVKCSGLHDWALGLPHLVIAYLHGICSRIPKGNHWKGMACEARYHGKITAEISRFLCTPGWNFINWPAEILMKIIQMKNTHKRVYFLL